MKTAESSVWWRPYPPGRGRWLIIGWEFAGLAFLDWTTARLFDLDAPAGWGLTSAFAVLWLVASYRVLRLGVYVNGFGLRVRGLLTSRTLRWTEIDRFVFDQPKYGWGVFQVAAGATVLVRRHNGEFIKTSLWAQGIDFHGRPRLFRDVYGLLCERHSAAVAASC